MEKFNSKVIKIAVCSVCLFVIGLLVGYQINDNKISSLQGYMLNDVTKGSRATTSNSTPSNSTSSNVSTSANADNSTSSNSTSSNASSSNVSGSGNRATDNIMYLQYFSLGSDRVNKGTPLRIILETSGACNSAASVVFKSLNGSSFTAKVENMNGEPYIVIPDTAVVGSYYVSDLLIVGKNSDGSTFTKQYSVDGANKFSFNSNLVVEDNQASADHPVSKVTLSSISLESSSAKVSESVYVNFQTSEKLQSLKLGFNSQDGKSFAVYVKNLNSKPYFEVPSSTLSGSYSLTGAIVTSANSSTFYTITGGNDTEQFGFNSNLEIVDSNVDTFIYNNEDINSIILSKLYEAPSGTVITVNADYSTLISEDLFNTIKGNNKKLIVNYKDNQVIFDGKDINNSKTIDINMNITDTSNNEEIGKYVSNGVIVSFPDNGNLPGKSLVRLKATSEVEKILKDKVYVYIYNEEEDKFSVVANDINKTSDGYY